MLLIFMQSIIVNEVAMLLHEVARTLKLPEQCYTIAEKVLKALIEMCSGNYANQLEAFKANILTTVIEILKIEPEQVCEMCFYKTFGMLVLDTLIL